jgi:hypothetical protein
VDPRSRNRCPIDLAITGVVFALLLTGYQEDLDTHIGWVNFVVHTLIPIVVVVDWLVEPSRHRLPLRVALAWLAYPIAWRANTLVRGPPRADTRTPSWTSPSTDTGGRW